MHHTNLETPLFKYAVPSSPLAVATLSLLGLALLGVGSIDGVPPFHAANRQIATRHDADAPARIRDAFGNPFKKLFGRKPPAGKNRFTGSGTFGTAKDLVLCGRNSGLSRTGGEPFDIFRTVPRIAPALAGPHPRPASGDAFVPTRLILPSTPRSPPLPPATAV